MKLDGKIAVVTGASRGIGKAIATRLASEGAIVAINYREDAKSAEALVFELNSRGFKYLGAAGSVSGFAVQFANSAGAIALAPASASGRGHVLDLDADEVIDYRAERFEDRTKDIDLVLDLVGGDTLQRSWAVLAPNGMIVSTAAPALAARVPTDRRGVGVMVHSDPMATGALRSTIAEVTGRSGLATAIERNKTGHAPGKMILDLTR